MASRPRSRPSRNQCPRCLCRRRCATRVRKARRLRSRRRLRRDPVRSSVSEHGVNMSTAAETPLIDALRNVTVFEGLTEEQLGWFVANVHELHFAAGELVVEGGTPADRMLIMLDGEVQVYRPDGGGLFSIKAGDVSGLLPFSRMITFASPVRATVPTRL